MLHLNFCFLFPFMTTHPVELFVVLWQLLCVNFKSKLLLCSQLSTGYLISLIASCIVHCLLCFNGWKIVSLLTETCDSSSSILMFILIDINDKDNNVK